jgi:hypothetical protein
LIFGIGIAPSSGGSEPIMSISPRTYRRAQLWGVRASDPAKFVTIYRETVGIDEDEPLPTGVSYAEMVNAILNREEIEHLSARVMQAISE